MSKLIDETNTENGEFNLAVWIIGLAWVAWMVTLLVCHAASTVARFTGFTLWKAGKVLVSVTIRLPFAWTRDVVREIA